MPEFIFMLTKNDVTVQNAFQVYEEVRHTSLKYIGFKDIGLPFDQLKELTRHMHLDGRQVMLEVVSERKEDELRSARAALDLEVDYLVGGTHAKEVTEILNGTNMKYFPFPGKIIGHPSNLRGTIDEIVDSAKKLAGMKGVHGLDLLAYRYDGDVPSLIRAVLASIPIPLIAAGSVDSTERLQALTDLGVWGLTVGSAIFDNKFLDSAVKNQVERVLALCGHK